MKGYQGTISMKQRRFLNSLTGVIVLTIMLLLLRTLFSGSDEAVLAAQISLTPTSTPLPTATPLLTTDYCAALPAGALSQAYFKLRRSYTIGCPQGAPRTVPAAFQPFEQGAMIWLEGTIYVVPSTNFSETITATWQVFPDTWDESQPVDEPSLKAPEGLQQPIRGFGKVWREALGGPAAAVGWATQPESGYQAVVQQFEQGQMIMGPGGEALVNCPSCLPAAPEPQTTPPPVWQVMNEWGEGFVELEAGPAGEMWAITPKRLFRFEGLRQTNFLTASNFLTGTQPSRWNIRELAVAPDGSPWLATDQGVYHAEGEIWPHWLADKVLFDIAFDVQGQAWVAGREKSDPATGRYDTPYFIKFFDGKNWQDAPPLNLNERERFEPMALTTTPEGHIWVALWGGLSHEYDGQSWARREGVRGLPENIVISGPGGQVWAGSVANRSWYRWQADTWYQPEIDLPTYPAMLMAVDSLGNAWGAVIAGCHECRIVDLNRTGAIYYSETGTCLLTAQDGLGGPPLDPQPLSFESNIPRPDAVFDIAVNTDGSIWFITQGKITIFRPQAPVCNYDIVE